MKEYIVKIPECWYQDVLIEAETREDAIKRVQEGEGEYLTNRLEFAYQIEEYNEDLVIVIEQ